MCLIEPGDGGGCGSGLEGQDLGGGVDAGQAFDGVGAGEVVVAVAQDLVEARAVGRGAGGVADDVAAAVGGVVLGEGEGQGVVGGGEPGGAFDGRDAGAVEPDGVGPVSPLAAQDVVGEVVFLVGSGGEGGDAGAAAGGDATFGHLGFDVAAALAELSAHGEGDAGDLADTVTVDVAVEQSLGLGQLVRGGRTGRRLRRCSGCRRAGGCRCP